MTDLGIAVDTVTFDQVPWDWKPQTEEIFPIKGTWTLAPPKAASKYKIKGIMSCPNCSAGAMLTEDMIVSDNQSRSGTLDLFRCYNCPFACKCIFKGWDTRKLFCVAYEKIVDGNIYPLTEYLHAESANQAARFFSAGHVNDSNPVSSIIGISQVIGYFVDDNKGLKLHV